MPITLQFKTDEGWSYKATVTEVPFVTTAIVTADSPPGKARLSQELDGQLQADVVSLDEGRNAPTEEVSADLQFDAKEPRSEEQRLEATEQMFDPAANPDSDFVSLNGAYSSFPCSASNNAGDFLYQCPTDSTSESAESVELDEEQAKRLATTIFTSTNVRLAVRAGNCGVYVDPNANTIVETSGSKEDGGCESFSAGDAQVE